MRTRNLTVPRRSKNPSVFARARLPTRTRRAPPTASALSPRRMRRDGEGSACLGDASRAATVLQLWVGNLATDID